jgi:MFS family permease
MAKNGTGHKNVIFIGLMLGMLVAAVSQTIVSPAMPVIVAELGGIEHYSWIATSALLMSAVTVPVVGKLSDMYGRRGFYISGVVVFMLGSILAGAAQGFWWLVAARAVQGFGMGTIMPLSQTIIGDIISARERGKYMGYLGGVFGVASIAGPFLGGWITDNFSWRWLFYVNLPIGLAALVFIVAYLHVPHTPRRHKLDYVGFAALPLALVAVLLATTWGGTTYPWDSWQIVSLYVVGALILIGFLINEYYTQEPVLPLRLWKDSVFTLSNISNLAIAMCMFGAIFFIPVYAQGVIGVNVTNSGAVLIPLTASMIVVSIVVGRLITRTGRYKGFTTSTTQLSRSMGATLGTAVFGTIMTNGMRTEIPKHLPPQTLNDPQAQKLSGGGGVGAVLDPNTLGRLPDAIVAGIREGLAAAMHPVFVVGIPIIAVAFVATLFINELPLRTRAFVEEVGGPEGATANGAGARMGGPSRSERLVMNGLALEYLAQLIENANGDSPNLVSAASALAPGRMNGSGTQDERARAAAREVVRPLALQMLLTATRRAPDKQVEFPIPAEDTARDASH